VLSLMSFNLVEIGAVANAAPMGEIEKLNIQDRCSTLTIISNAYIDDN
jgi:hypothetical protein